MNNFLFIISFGLILLTTACAPNRRTLFSKSLIEYYYPVEELEQPKVYHYKTGKELNKHVFWKLSTEIDNGNIYLISDVYSYDEKGELSKIEEVKEKITDKGAFVVEHAEYEQDDFDNTFKLNSVIGDNCVFLWKVKFNEKIEWNYSNQSKIFENRTQFVNKKSYLESTEQQIVFNGSKYKTVVFKDRFYYEYTNNITKKVESSFRIQQISYYAKGLGLISYKLKIPSGPEMTFTLDEILSEDEWDKLLNN